MNMFETLSHESGTPWDMVAGVPHTASVKPTPAIRVRIRLRRLIFSHHARCCSGLQRPKASQCEMTDNNGITIHHIDTWEKSEAKSRWCSSGPLGPGSFQHLAFYLEKDADWWPDSRTFSSGPRNDCPRRKVSYCGKFCFAVCVEKNKPHEPEWNFLQTRSMASHPLRHSPWVQVERYGCDRTTEDDQGWWVKLFLRQTSELFEISGLSRSPA